MKCIEKASATAKRRAVLSVAEFYRRFRKWIEADSYPTFLRKIRKYRGYLPDLLIDGVNTDGYWTQVAPAWTSIKAEMSLDFVCLDELVEIPQGGEEDEEV